MNQEIQMEHKFTRSGRLCRWRNYALLLSDCKYKDSEENPYFRLQNDKDKLYVGNRRCDVISHVQCDKSGNYLEAAVLFNDDIGQWVVLPVATEIRKHININGDFVKGLAE